jgi:hypothetical protein
MVLPGAGGAKANLITNNGFEITETTGDGLPDMFGDWDGDDSAIVTSENGITSFEGLQMLHFIATTSSGPHPSFNASEVFQLIDMNPFSTAISTGLAIASASAHFNRVTGDSQTDTRFAVALYAFAGSPSTFPSDFPVSNFLTSASRSVFTDGDTATWEIASVDLLLPTNTDYLALRLTASEDIFNDGTAPEFDGHYADKVSLNVNAIPEPSTYLLLVVSIFAVFVCRWLRQQPVT